MTDRIAQDPGSNRTAGAGARKNRARRIRDGGKSKTRRTEGTRETVKTFGHQGPRWRGGKKTGARITERQVMMDLEVRMARSKRKASWLPPGSLAPHHRCERNVPKASLGPWRPGPSPVEDHLSVH